MPGSAVQVRPPLLVSTSKNPLILPALGSERAPRFATGSRCCSAEFGIRAPNPHPSPLHHGDGRQFGSLSPRAGGCRAPACKKRSLARRAGRAVSGRAGARPATRANGAFLTEGCCVSRHAEPNPISARCSRQLSSKARRHSRCEQAAVGLSSWQHGEVYFALLVKLYGRRREDVTTRSRHPEAEAKLECASCALMTT